MNCLWTEFLTVKPKIVIPLGGVSTRLLMMHVPEDRFVMGQWACKGPFQMPYMKSLIYPLWHPSYLLRTPSLIEETTEVFTLIKYRLEHDKLL